MYIACCSVLLLSLLLSTTYIVLSFCDTAGVPVTSSRFTFLSGITDDIDVVGECVEWFQYNTNGDPFSRSH